MATMVFYGSSVGTGRGGGGGSSYIGGVANANLDRDMVMGLLLYTRRYMLIGCTDSTALNYDSMQIMMVRVYIALMDVQYFAFNYDSLAADDGSCVPFVYGCTLPINYYPGANTDDGSCIYAGCTDSNATNYDQLLQLMMVLVHI